VEQASTDSKKEKDDAEAGKILTPNLKKILEYSQGLKLVLMTATPMYNTYKEIINLINFMLLNDKKALIKETDIFDYNGNISENGKRMLILLANHYISYMRGENPNSFPMRLYPFYSDPNVLQRFKYPLYNPKGTTIKNRELESIYIRKLPIQLLRLDNDCFKASAHLISNIKNSDSRGELLRLHELSNLVVAGIFISPPKTEDDIYDYEQRLKSDVLKKYIMVKEKQEKEVVFRSLIDPKWLYTGESYRAISDSGLDDLDGGDGGR
jgi:hypothetical protein